MARFPTPQDYGARPSLRSSRVDAPIKDTAIADAFANAASTFANMAIEHKQKDDALNYSNAKNEYLIADITEREKLKEDPDFDTFDERYRTAMKGHYDRLFPTVTSGRDRSLFDAEARLMNERGAVNVGEMSRTRRLDHEVGQYRENSEANKALMTVTDPATANDMMLTHVDQITALGPEGRGVWTDEQVQAEIETSVQDWAFDRLIVMDPAERQVVLERALTATKAKGKPLSREEIAAGEGTGSIADFLHPEVAARMLKESKVENDLDAELTIAMDLADEAEILHPEDPKARSSWARAQAKKRGLDGTTRQRLDSVLSGRATEYRNGKNDNQNRIMASATELMTQDDPDKGRPWTYEEIPNSEKKHLEPHQLQSLERYSQSVQEGRQGFANFNQLVLDPNIKSYAEWSNLSRAEKGVVPLDNAEWKSAFTTDQWRRFKEEQKDIIANPDKVTPLPSGLTNNQLVLGTLISNGTIPQTARDPEHNEAYQRTLMLFDNAIQDAQKVKGSALDNQERRKVLAEIMGPTAFTDSYYEWPFFGSGADTDAEDRSNIATMSAAEIQSGRLPLDEKADETARISPSGIETTYAEELRAYGVKYGVTPSTLDYERAFFAWKNEMGDAEIARRLGVSENKILELQLK